MLRWLFCPTTARRLQATRLWRIGPARSPQGRWQRGWFMFLLHGCASQHVSHSQLDDGERAKSGRTQTAYLFEPGCYRDAALITRLWPRLRPVGRCAVLDANRGHRLCFCPAAVLGVCRDLPGCCSSIATATMDISFRIPVPAPVTSQHTSARVFLAALAPAVRAVTSQSEDARALRGGRTRAS